MIKILDFSSKSENEIISFLNDKIKVHMNGISILKNKIRNYNIYVDRISNKAANILKQDMLSIGGDIAVHSDVVRYKDGNNINSCLIIGTKKQILLLIEKLKNQPFGLKDLSKEIEISLTNYEEFANTKNYTKLMGILNLTKDSFYDGGKYNLFDAAMKRVDEMIENGVDIIDIGAESTRPNSLPTSERQEIKKIIPILKSIRKKYKNIPISIDTYRSKVAEACITEGANIINDISACTFDTKMANVASKYKSQIVLMHIKGTPKDMQKNPNYKNLVEEVVAFLDERIEYSIKEGIKKENIILDPGLGFGKTVEHNLEILRKINEFKSFCLPILVGASRKSFIGAILNEEVQNRLAGTLGISAYLTINNINIIRVHDVKENRQIIDIIKKLRQIY